MFRLIGFFALLFILTGMIMFSFVCMIYVHRTSKSCSSKYIKKREGNLIVLKKIKRK